MGSEQSFSCEHTLLSTTDTDSRIKYANQAFCDIAGYSEDELIGNFHNMVRHPEMPKEAFKDMWTFLKAGRSWMGPVKNRCKNGDFYWVNAYVTPIKDKNGRTYEFQSVRTCLDKNVQKRTDKTYQSFKNNTPPRALQHSTDQSLWFQAFIFSVTLLFATLSALGMINLFLGIFTSLISGIMSIIFLKWRKTYRETITEAKSVFDNPMMSYLYSGSNDDIGTINLALKMRKAELNAVVGRVKDSSVTIKDKGEEAVNCGQNISSILEKQNQETDQVATAMTEMSATVQELSKVVCDASNASQAGLKISNDGHKIVLETIEANTELAGQLTEVENAIEQLTTGCKSIESVLNEINGIAEQTNLLALNAAIEAARAGEQGRGFSVVADEVRALAIRTQQSTKEINSLLSQLHNESKNANDAMEKGSGLSNRCVELSSQTDEVLQTVISEVNQLTCLNDQIATAIEEQSIVTEDINRNIVAISDMSATGDSHGKQAVNLTRELFGRLEEQQSLISQFSN